MNMKKWWPYLAIGGAAVVVSVAYPAYFRWWDHKSCEDSGGEWSPVRHGCIEPRNAQIPDTKPSQVDQPAGAAGSGSGGARPFE